MSTRRILLASLAITAVAVPSRAQGVALSPLTTFDISALSIEAAGDLAFEHSASRLCIADGATNGLVYVLSPSTGALILTVNPAAIPGLDAGPDAIAFATTSGASDDLYVLSSFGESEGGRITQAGALVQDFGTSQGATGADTDANGVLWIATGTTAGGGSTLRRINTATGAILQSVPILGVSARTADIAFDPWLGGLHVLGEDGILREIDLTSGATLGSINLNGNLPGSPTVATGVTFGNLGQRLYVARELNNAVDEIVVFRRDLTETVCTGDAQGFTCPCANQGTTGRGCNNSFNTGGARISGTGVPDLSIDSFQLEADGMPPTTTCLFFQGTVLPVEVFPFGDGLRCVTGTVIRLGTKTVANGSAVYPGQGDATVGVRGQIPAQGATRYYQTWYRNAATFCTASTFNLSNSIKVVWRP